LINFKAKTLTTAFLVLLIYAAACGGESSGNWNDLPEYLSGSVIVYGDSRTGHDMHRNIMKGMASLEPEAVFHTGDLVSNGRDPENWVIFNNIASQLPSHTPIYPALGNHEHASSLYFDNFDLPGNERWYSVDDIDGLKFIILDSGSELSPATTLTPASPQYQWLESELSSGVSATDVSIVLFHYPLYSTGYHGSDDKDIRDSLVPLFQKYGVDAVFNGHDHDYERFTINGIRYIVTGGGGAPLRNQRGTSIYSELFVKVHHFCALYFDGGGRLMVEVWSDKAKRIDEFEIQNR
jgi:predicted phosphodiesterase